LWLTGLGNARDGRLGVFDVFDAKLNEDDLDEGGRLGAETFGCRVICDADVEVEDRLRLAEEAGGVCFGDDLRPNRPFFDETGVDDGEAKAGTGGVVTMLNGWAFFVMTLATLAENDLDLGRAARKPGRGPATDSSRGIGDVMLREG
jgi:hypothetical protein